MLAAGLKERANESAVWNVNRTILVLKVMKCKRSRLWFKGLEGLVLSLIICVLVASHAAVRPSPAAITASPVLPRPAPPAVWLTPLSEKRHSRCFSANCQEHIKVYQCLKWITLTVLTEKVQREKTLHCLKLLVSSWAFTSKTASKSASVYNRC